MYGNLQQNIENFANADRFSHNAEIEYNHQIFAINAQLDQMQRAEEQL